MILMDKMNVTLGAVMTGTYIFQAESLPFDFFHIVDFAAITEFSCQHPLKDNNC